MTTHKRWQARKAGDRIQKGFFLLAMAVLLYGVIRYPNAPIELRNDGHYRDKAKKVYSEAQFRSFKMWQHSFVGSFAVLLAVMAIVEVADRRRRTR